MINDQKNILIEFKDTERYGEKYVFSEDEIYEDEIIDFPCDQRHSRNFNSLVFLNFEHLSAFLVNNISIKENCNMVEFGNHRIKSTINKLCEVEFRVDINEWRLFDDFINNDGNNYNIEVLLNNGRSFTTRDCLLYTFMDLHIRDISYEKDIDIDIFIVCKLSFDCDHFVFSQ